MKTQNLFITVLMIASVFLFIRCEEGDNVDPASDTILPEQFMIDIPDAISHSNQLKSATADTLKGDEIYEHMGSFIHIGEEAAKIVQEIIVSIMVYNINEPMEFVFKGDDDNRDKKVVVVENSEYDETTWEFQLTISDVESLSNPDEGKGIQVFWNRNPIKGVALLKPSNINKNDRSVPESATFRIDYSEAGDIAAYEKYMVVYIAGLLDSSNTYDRFAMNTLKMFVGKTGDIIDVYGNSNHPNASFFTEETGFNWAFVASGYESIDIGVAEVGLPPSTLDETSREVLLDEYSIKNVFIAEITQWFLDTWGIAPDANSLSGYLKDADAPGYFNSNGFVAGGTSPGSEYDEIEVRLEDMVPYNPVTISNLTVNFK